MAVAAAGQLPTLPSTGKDLILIGRAPLEADLTVATGDGNLRFSRPAGKEISATKDDIVRWSTPAAAQSADEIHLVDGSKICLAPSWSDARTLTVDAETFIAKTVLLGRVEASRSQLRAMLWRLPADEAQRQARLRQLLDADNTRDDVLMLADGDILRGKLTILETKIENGRRLDSPHAIFDSTIGRVSIPLERVAGILIAPRHASKPDGATRPDLWIGLRDGSLIAASTFAASADSLVISAVAAGELHGGSVRDIVAIQAQSQRAVYLSDVKPIEYQHQPYLEVGWPYRRNCNVLGGVPTVGERRHLKALSMHSASQLTFDLDGAYDRFAATVAIDAIAEGGGSVVFRVLLKTGERWREAYASGIVRGDDPPQEVEVPLTAATQLSLAVDYADRGDERDYANWLDPRIEQVR